MTNIDVIGLGALNIDRIYLASHTLDNSEAVVTEAGSFPGGSAANTIYGLARLGVTTGFIGAVGDDADGKKLLSDFKKAGVDSSHIKLKPGAKTGATLCFSTGSGRRSLYVSPGANSLLTTEDIDLAYLNQAQVLHISSFADDRQFQMVIQVVGEVTVKVSFAPGAIYARKGLKELAPILARTHILFLNKDEIKQLTGKDLAAAAEICLGYGCHIVAVTLGEGVSYKNVLATSYIRDAENEYIIDSANKEPASAVDTTGAGDAYAAGFLYGFVNGKGLKECGQLGNTVARLSVGKIGARTGLPGTIEISQRYRELYR